MNYQAFIENLKSSDDSYSRKTYLFSCKMGLTAHGLLGRRHLGPASATWLGEVGAGSIKIPTFLGWGVRAVPRFPRVWCFGAL